ncbi:DUF4446 family protein [Salsipaludibacter albus]|uniref:DUF4446 family protein n=1 Tax=Salsipaludibacter albus TaxID=2849650 RepID=UPI001EE47ED4|nr:DUF4446 family protein [Salsipaludibacter albus]MBY5161424.1 DUF4446 family protein [Salsipaludibacter albus]
MELSTELVVAVVAVVLAAVAIGVAWWSARRVRRVDRYVAAAEGDGAGLVSTVQQHADQLRELRTDLLVVHDNTTLLRRMAKDSLSRIGLVRYDAFADLAGAMSFSLAQLDERGDGVVLSAIAGRSDSRFYAKPIEGGRCEYELTPEERIAIERAIAGERAEAIVEVERTRRGSKAS